MFLTAVKQLSKFKLICLSVTFTCSVSVTHRMIANKTDFHSHYLLRCGIHAILKKSEESAEAKDRKGLRSPENFQKMERCFSVCVLRDQKKFNKDLAGSSACEVGLHTVWRFDQGWCLWKPGSQEATFL